MSAQGAKQYIQISVGIDLSTVVIGGTKVEVASDGKKVTAYTNEGVETKAAAAGAVAAEGTQIVRIQGRAQHRKRRLGRRASPEFVNLSPAPARQVIRWELPRAPSWELARCGARP